MDGRRAGRETQRIAVTVVTAMLVAAGALAPFAAAPAPADEHARALQAYQRGDVATAMKLLRPPAAAGHAPSQTLLAFILERADFADEAARLYRSAADQGDPEAMAGLANLLFTGRGVAKDEKQAFALFSKAADAGHASALQVVADAYLARQMGQLPGARDDAAAVATLQRAAAQGHAGAAAGLTKAYSAGDFGLAPDAQQAARWQARSDELRRAAAGAASAPARARR